MKRILAALAALIAPLALAATVTTEIPGTFDLYQGSRKLSAQPTYAACLAKAQGFGVVSTFTCQTITTITIRNVIPPKPADETRVSACPMAGLPGNLSWTQTRTYAPAPAPVFWQAQQWLPSVPQPPACVPIKPADETQMVTCPAGSITGAQWMQTRTYVAAPAPQFWSAQAWTPAQPQVGTCPPATDPHMHGGVQVDTSVPFPAGQPGRNVELVQSPPGGNLAPGRNNTGDFRTVCGLVRYAFDDPIVHFGVPGAAHLHSIFGNTGLDAFSTYDSLGAGNSTCRGGTVNLSAYWAPSVIDSVTHKVVPDSQAIIYYKNGNGDLHPETVQPLPKGLRMLAGDPNGKTPVRFGVAGFSCSGFQFAGDGDPWTGGNHVIPSSCPVLNDPGQTHELWRVMTFPDCWDGVNLDSSDHKSHMAYWPSPNRNPDGTSREICPPDHPVKIPQLTIIIKTPIPLGMDMSKLVLSCETGIPGSCMHADYMERWNRNGGPNKDIDRAKQFTDGCNRAMLDCGASLLDSNTEMLGFDDV